MIRGVKQYFNSNFGNQIGGVVRTNHTLLFVSIERYTWHRNVVKTTLFWLD